MSWFGDGVFMCSAIYLYRVGTKLAYANLAARNPMNLKTAIRSFSKLFLVLQSPLIHALDEDNPELPATVVTANRSITPLNQVGSSISVVTQEDIQKRQVVSVADALRLIPGLDVLASGGPGHTTSVLLRGANSSQTLVIIDGVEMNDPSSPNNAFDFANLTTDNIERIEVLRGGESALYGSNAIGGVINIITKKGSGSPKLALNAQGGSFGTYKVLGGISGQSNRMNYNLSASRLETDSYSAADVNRGNKEADKYRNTTVDGRVGLKALDNLDFGFNLRFNEGRNYLDYDYPLPYDALNYTGKTDELYTRGFSELRLFDDIWKQTLGVAYNRTERTTQNFDPTLPYSLNSSYLGEKVKVDWQNVIKLGNSNTLTFGAEDEQDSMYSPTDPIGSKSYNTQGYYLLSQFNPWDRWFGSASVRYDNISGIADKVTWRITQTLFLDSSKTAKLKGSYGTGFRAPSLAELYDPFVGNPNLISETSTNWDIGVEKSFLNNRLSISSTYFNNYFNNLIVYSPASYKVENIENAMAEGVENIIDVKATDNLSIKGNYTYTHTEDFSTGDRLLRRPTNKGSVEGNYFFMDRANINLSLLAVGNKSDLNSVVVPGYVLVNLTATYTFTKNISGFAKVVNLLDKQYEELYGYGTSRISGYAGITLTF